MAVLGRLLELAMIEQVAPMLCPAYTTDSRSIVPKSGLDSSIVATLANSTDLRRNSPLVLVVSGCLSFSGDLIWGKTTTAPCDA